jgi:D-xylose transport system substrate-binding protein
VVDRAATREVLKEGFASPIEARAYALERRRGWIVHQRFRSKTRNPVWFLAVAVVAALAIVAAGCGGDDGGGTDTTAAGACDGSIWVLLPDTASSPRWESDDRRYFEEAFTAAGVEHSVVNAEGEATTQQSQAEQAINAGAKVIVLTSLDTGSGAAIIDQAKEAGIDVIEYDRFNTGSSGGAAYVSFDNVAVGATMAEVLEPIIDGLDVETPQVVQLNGGEEDNNAFLFKDGYSATVQKHVDDGRWALAGDQFVPGWGANGEGQTIMEQILTDAGNKVDAVFAANDNLAQQAINALEAAGVGPVPLSGQDASATGIQNILLGNQTMTVYKPIRPRLMLRPRCAGTLRRRDVASVRATSSSADRHQRGHGKPATRRAKAGFYFALVPIGVTETTSPTL